MTDWVWIMRADYRFLEFFHFQIFPAVPQWCTEPNKRLYMRDRKSTDLNIRPASDLSLNSALSWRTSHSLKEHRLVHCSTTAARPFARSICRPLSRSQKKPTALSAVSSSALHTRCLYMCWSKYSAALETSSMCICWTTETADMSNTRQPTVPNRWLMRLSLQTSHQLIANPIRFRRWAFCTEPKSTAFDWKCLKLKSRPNKESERNRMKQWSWSDQSSLL